MDLAASIQAVTEEIDAAADARRSRAETGAKNLCLAGGVALNCVANGKVLRDGALREHLDPAGGGRRRRRARRGARGLSSVHGQRRARPTTRATPCSGVVPRARRSRSAEIERRAAPRRRALRRCSSDDAADRRDVRTALADGKAVGWFQGRMEFGPRALGGRSILGDPRSPDHADSAQPQGQVPRVFRPFAPSVLREDVADWFELDERQPLHAAGRRRAWRGAAAA